jgi:hypothetical protein
VHYQLASPGEPLLFHEQVYVRVIVEVAPAGQAEMQE